MKLTIKQLEEQLGEARRELMQAHEKVIRLEVLARGANGHGPAFEMLLSFVCEKFCLTQAQLLSRSRNEELVWPRQMFMHVLHVTYGWGWSQIGRALNRDHGTVMHAHQCVKDAVSVYPAKKEQLDQLITEAKKFQAAEISLGKWAA